MKALASGQDYNRGPAIQPDRAMALLSKPLIAAVAGYACAGGLGVALRCDLRVAEESATFAVLSRRWGVPMSDGTTVGSHGLSVPAGRLDMF